MNAMFARPGPRRIMRAIPAFLETESGSYKPLGECSRDGVEAKNLSLTMQAQALMDEAKAPKSSPRRLTS